MENENMGKTAWNYCPRADRTCPMRLRNASMSWMASSESILRFMTIPALFKPFMNALAAPTR